MSLPGKQGKKEACGTNSSGSREREHFRRSGNVGNSGISSNTVAATTRMKEPPADNPVFPTRAGVSNPRRSPKVNAENVYHSLAYSVEELKYTKCPSPVVKTMQEPVDFHHRDGHFRLAPSTWAQGYFPQRVRVATIAARSGDQEANESLANHGQLLGPSWLVDNNSTTIRKGQTAQIQGRSLMPTGPSSSSQANNSSFTAVSGTCESSTRGEAQPTDYRPASVSFELVDQVADNSDCLSSSSDQETELVSEIVSVDDDTIFYFGDLEEYPDEATGS